LLKKKKKKKKKDILIKYKNCYRVSHSLWNLNNWTNVTPVLQELLKEINIKDNTAGKF